jgi:hypothetical protein
MTVKQWTTCWRWDCLICGKIMRLQWVKHLTEVTQGQKLYLLKAKKWSWNRILGQLIEAKAEWVKCDSLLNEFILITNKPIENSQPIRASNREAVVRRAVMRSDLLHPLLSPISASSAWQLPKEKLEEYIEEI